MRLSIASIQDTDVVSPCLQRTEDISSNDSSVDTTAGGYFAGEPDWRTLNPSSLNDSAEENVAKTHQIVPIDTGTKPLATPNCWDHLPVEIQQMVLKYAGPFTRFLHGRLGSFERLSRDTILQIWTGVFCHDWAGDLRALPDTPIPTHREFMFVQSRAMYMRLCARFPRLTESNTEFARADAKGVCAELEESRLRHIPMRHCWLDLLELRYPDRMAMTAISHGYDVLLRYLSIEAGLVYLPWMHQIQSGSFGSEPGGLVMDVAARCGHLKILEILHAAGSNACSTHAIDGAATHGHLDVVKWLHKHRSEGCTTEAMDCAALEGHLDVMIWLHENRTEGCTSAAIDRAALRGHLHVVQWLHVNRTEGCTRDAMNWASRGGHLEVVRWLHINRSEGCGKAAMNGAARYGHLHVIKWLHMHRTEGCTVNAIDWAAQHGHTETVKWLLENRIEGFSIHILYQLTDEQVVAMLVAGLSADQHEGILHRARWMRRPELVLGRVGQIAF